MVHKLCMILVLAKVRYYACYLYYLLYYLILMLKLYLLLLRTFYHVISLSKIYR